MDRASYKELVTRRGFKYSYFASTGSGPLTVLLLHGYPSLSGNWRRQVPVLQEADYSIIAPDLLGFGGTDRPLETKYYVYSAMVEDILDILDAEGAGKTVVIGHDRGSVLAARLANYHPTRFSGFAFLSLGYVEPPVDLDFQRLCVQTKSTFGYELDGYWEFCSEDGAEELVREHWDSYYSLAHPVKPETWRIEGAALGMVKAWLLADKVTPLPAYLTEEDKQRATSMNFRVKSGFAGAHNWYKLIMKGFENEDNKNIPPENYVIRQPVFYGGGTLDSIFIPALYKAQMAKLCPHLTMKEYERDFWLILDRPEELNRDLVEWLGAISASA